MTKDQQPLDEMFPELLSTSKWLGFDIGEGWRCLVIEACRQFQNSLSPDDLKIFRLIQVKSKMAGLRIYFEPSQTLPVSIFDEDGVTNFDFPMEKEDDQNQEPCLSEMGYKTVLAIIHQAEHKADRTCEICGDRGRLYTGGYWATLCDLHAKEHDRTFPKAYGVPVECRPHRQNFRDGREAICDQVLYFKNTAAPIWRWADDDATGSGSDHSRNESFFWLDDVPQRLGDVYFDETDGKFSAPGAGNDDEWALYVDHFLKVVNKARRKEGVTSILEPFFTLPPGVRVDPRTQLERDIAETLDLNVTVKQLLPLQSFGGYAIGSDQEGTSLLFDIKHKSGPKKITSPRLTLTTTLRQLEIFKTRIVGALTLFPEKSP